MITTTDLFNHIMGKNPGGISSEDAKQLFLLLYCTLGVLPERFRHLKLGRTELAQIFLRIAAEGKITTDAILGESVDDFKEEAYWQTLVDLLLRKKVTLDESFWSRCPSFL
jgi:hypothetical protein